MYFRRPAEQIRFYTDIGRSLPRQCTVWLSRHKETDSQDTPRNQLALL